MVAKYLTWIFLGLFLLFGLIALADDGEAYRRFWFGWALIALGGFVVAMIKDAVNTGRLRLQYSVIYRANRPRLFWACNVFLAAAGIVVLVGGVIFLTRG